VKSQYYCYEIDHNLAIWAHNDQVSYTPCSFNKGLYYGKTKNIIDTNQIWKNKKHIEIQTHVAKNQQVDGCYTCYNAELSGQTSRRQAVESMYENFLDFDKKNNDNFVSVDFSVGNLCNLKCLICGPENSTAWLPDYQKLFPNVNVEQFKYKVQNQINIDNSVLNGNIKRIHFHGGGEPLLSDHHVNFLKLIKKQKKLSDVYVFYNTNGTVKVTKEILDIWAECKFVELYFSIDDLGKRLEYQRPGIVWEELQSNLFWYKENMPDNHMFKINCVYSYLNFYYLNELHNWYNNVFCENRFGDKVEFIFQKVHGNQQYDLELYKLNSLQYETLANKFHDNKILSSILSSITVRDEEKHNDFFSIIRKFDSIKNIKYADSHNEWLSLLQT
jgi:hypothetical protein